MNQIDRAREGPRDCPVRLKSACPGVERGGMRFEPSELPGFSRRSGLSVAIQCANDCLRLAVEAVASFTEAPVRLELVSQSGRRQVFEALEEFELGGYGRRFVVSVDHRSDRVVVISAGRPM